jgi:hypothetical protein
MSISRTIVRDVVRNVVRQIEGGEEAEPEVTIEHEILWSDGELVLWSDGQTVLWSS